MPQFSTTSDKSPGEKSIPTSEELQEIARKLRIDIIEMIARSGSGHLAGSLSSADILAVLYFAEMSINPKNPHDPMRDIFILSNGHICPALYSALAEKGFFPKQELSSFAQTGALLQGHPSINIPGVETGSGSLGQGISIAVGWAISNKMDKQGTHIYCLSSDGELNEGQTWEAVMLGAKYKLENLTWIIDRNNIQIGGNTEDIMPLESLRDKLESFNWYVIEIDGNNIAEVLGALRLAKKILNRPTAIIAHTTPGKGVDFMENDPSWHGKAPTEEESLKALRELRKIKVG